MAVVVQEAVQEEDVLKNVLKECNEDVSAKGFSFNLDKIAHIINESNKPCVTILEGIMGVGKSTHIIDKLKKTVENKGLEDSYLVILPLRSEIDRYQEACPELRFKTPTLSTECKTLKDDFERLVGTGENILTTHAMFENWDYKTAGLVEAAGYHIIIDEAVSCLEPVYLTNRQIEELTKLELININPETKEVCWDFDKTGYDYDGVTEGKRLMKKCLTGSVYQFGKEEDKNKFFVWEVPYKFFEVGLSYKILTYMFKSSELAAYFKTHGIDYKIEQIDSVRAQEIKERARELITFIEPTPKMKQIGIKKTALSKGFCDKLAKKDMTSLRASVGNLLRRTIKANPEDVMWTCLGDYKNYHKSKKHLSIPGYAYRYVAFNCRGTNNYSGCTSVVHLYNTYPNPSIEKYLKKRGSFSRDQYALSSLVQFIWRSAIRDGKPIKLLIASNRMRKLFDVWLHKDEPKC